MKIRKLDKSFTGTGEVSGYLFEQIKESDDAYIYKVSNENEEHYEVFLKKTVPVCIDFENRVYSDTESKEIYPKSKDWGKSAWTTNTLENATYRLENMKKESAHI
jgi:hypothetical protein